MIGPSTGGVRTLRHGQFFGRPTRKVAAGQFALADTYADPYLVVERHTHENAHFIVVLSGQYVTSARHAQPLIVAPPALLIYNPAGTTHTDRFRPTSGRCDGRFFSVSFPAHLAELRDPDTAMLDDATCLSSVPAVTAAARLIRECQGATMDSAFAVEALCFELLSNAARRPAEARRRPSWLRRARELLRDDRSDHLSVRDVARACGVHPVYFARAFHQHMRCSPGEYRRRTRLERAVALLAGTRSRLAEVALESGFADQSHMTRQFRRSFRLSPAEFRRLAR